MMVLPFYHQLFLFLTKTKWEKKLQYWPFLSVCTLFSNMKALTLLSHGIPEHPTMIPREELMVSSFHSLLCVSSWRVYRFTHTGLGSFQVVHGFYNHGLTNRHPFEKKHLREGGFLFSTNKDSVHRLSAPAKAAFRVSTLGDGRALIMYYGEQQKKSYTKSDYKLLLQYTSK
uniref:Uncharacterized protein n=1 Tax=Anguilla anguilla TaxID=7936 RepID=A0A0E9X3J5_ANGAN